MGKAFEGIALQAAKHEKVQTIMHYVNKQTLIQEHMLQKSEKATGIDNVSKEEYGKRIEENVDKLLSKMKTFSYKPQSVRRTYIPKMGSDKLRPLGIPAYEDKLVQGVMRKILDQIIEDMQYYESDKGTPQGGLISPVLANVYLHYVLDMWFEIAVRKKCKGEAYIIRYADDFVCFFQYGNEAEQFYVALEERLRKFGLELAKDKSKIMRFGRFAKQNSKDGKTETFDFLGFKFINGETLTGKYRIVYRTSDKKLKAKKQSVKEWLMSNIHGKPSDTIELLNRKITGHYAYYGISGNYQGLLNFYRFVVSALYKVLTRRSQRTYLSWKRYQSLLMKHPIVMPKIYASVW